MSGIGLKKVLRAHKKQATSHLLVTPRYEQYLAKTGNILVDETVGEFIKQELITPQRNRRMTFSASSRGMCPRAQVFQFTSLKPRVRLNSDLHAIFHQGTFMHLKWQALLLDAGILDEVEISVRWDEQNLTGTIDGSGLIPEDHPLYHPTANRFGWEFKSANSNNYKWVQSNGPMEKHILQIHAYMIAYQVYIWSLVYENKDDQQWKEFTVLFDPKIGEQVEDELAMLNAHVRSETLPPILESCAKKQGPYRNCDFAGDCLTTHEWPRPVQRRIKIR